MNGHDEETYERKDLPTAFISREEHERILKEFKKVLNDIELKHIEYKECVNTDNMNSVYFQGKRDAYEFAAKLLKRAFEWHGL